MNRTLWRCQDERHDKNIQRWKYAQDKEDKDKKNKSIGIHGGWGRAKMLVTDSGRKIETTSRTVNYMNTHLSHDMLYYGVS